MDRIGREIAAIFLGAHVGRKLDPIATAAELVRQRGGGKEMPARATGGEQDRALAHATCSLALAAVPVEAPGTGARSNRPARGRRRVSPRAKPMVSAMASKDEPP